MKLAKMFIENGASGIHIEDVGLRAREGHEVMSLQPFRLYMPLTGRVAQGPSSL